MKHRVLVVDDDPAVLQSIKRVLEGAGYEVVLAADGATAKREFIPGRIDLLLLDLNLPFESGWDIFERLTTRHPFTPVIIITGMPNQYRTALAAGAAALMEKPIEVTTLFRTMKDLLAESREEQLLRLCGYREDTRHVKAAANRGRAGADRPVPGDPGGPPCLEPPGVTAGARPSAST